MRIWSLSLVLLLGLLGLAACGPAKRVTPAPGTPAPGVKPAWEEEWDRVLAAAKQEGTVAVIGPTGDRVRQALTEPFQKKYSITVDYLSVSGSQIAPRLQAERAAGKYLWDIFVGGYQTMVGDLKPQGVFDPIEPTLMLPEVKDPRDWLGGGLSFVDRDHMALLFTSYSGMPAWINTTLVKPDEVKSWKDLLDPKWRGKLVATDPRVAGPGQATFSFFYAHRDLGPDFVRALAKQEVVFYREYIRSIEGLARGVYAICLGCSDSDSRPLMEQGLPIRPLDARSVKEGGYLSGGNGVIGLMNKAPHPNAARVFINWLLTREGQIEFNRAQGFASRRLDVPNKDWISPELLPVETFWNAYSEEGLVVRERLVPLLKEILGD